MEQGSHRSILVKLFDLKIDKLISQIFEWEWIFMKFFLALSLFFVSLSTFASGPKLLLDAACKIGCYTGETMVDDSVDQGYPKTSRFYEYRYFDKIGLTREQLESKEQLAEFVQFCKKTLSEKADYKDHECLFYKH